MRRGHVKLMTRVCFSPFALAIVVSVLLAGCTTTGNAGNVRGGAGSGWENFRAQLPALQPSAT